MPPSGAGTGSGAGPRPHPLRQPGLTRHLPVVLLQLVDFAPLGPILAVDVDLVVVGAEGDLCGARAAGAKPSPGSWALLGGEWDQPGVTCPFQCSICTVGSHQTPQPRPRAVPKLALLLQTPPDPTAQCHPWPSEWSRGSGGMEWDETGSNGMGWDDCGCSAPIQPHPALPAQHASHSRESPFCSLPHPLRCGREMPSAVNHPALLSSPCFVRLPWCLRAGCCAGPPTHPHTPGSALAAGPGGCRGEILAVPVPKSVCGRTCFPKPSPNPALPHLGRRGGASPAAGMFSQDSRYFGPRLGILGWGTLAVLTGPVLVPGMAADGLQQEAVVSHGLRAGDRARPPWPSGHAALATGTSTQQDPQLPAPPRVPSRWDQSRVAAHHVPPSAREGFSWRISKLRDCSSLGGGGG